ncbi:MAG TPA: NUDIX hydrolase, partial [Candidatus Obscuribacter sp.]|nr:NUDIX hydrolase [Candidatus Obscuribacter sp.]
HPPHQGCFALPGGFLDDEDESLAQAARRELQEETNISVGLEQLSNFGTYGDKGRDPRGRTVTAAFLVELTESQAESIQAGDDAAKAHFYALSALPELAFDHKQILEDALKYRALLRSRDGD